MRWICVAAMAAAVLGAMILAPGVAAAQDPLWSYTHPEAKVLIGIDWQRAKTSPAGRLIQKQMLGSGAAKAASVPGMEVLESVERILISAPGELSGNPAESPVLAAIQGKLNQAELRKSMIPGTAVERYRGVDLLIPPRGAGQDMIAAVINDSLTLLGDRPSIEAALNGGQGGQDAALRARAVQMAANCEIWMIADTPPVKAGTAGEAKPPAPRLENTQAMDLGVALSKGLGLKMTMHFPDAASAQSVALGTQMLTSMLMSGNASSPELAKIARSLNIVQTGPALQMNLDVPLDLLEKGLIQAQASFGEAAPKTLESLLGLGAPAGPGPGGARPAATAQPVEPAWPTASRVWTVSPCLARSLLMWP